MKNIINDLHKFINKKVTFDGGFYIDVFINALSPQYIIRADPSNPVETRYMDGARQGTFNFSVYGRGEDSGPIYDKLCEIQEKLDLADVSLTTFTRVTINPVSGISIVSKDANGEYIYQSGYRLDYYTGGK